MAPCPGIRRGFDATVPTVPGLVSEMVVPWKSAARQFAPAGAADKIVERRDVLLEVQRAGVADIGHHEVAAAILAGDVHGNSQVDVRPHHAERLPVSFRVRVIQPRKFSERFDDAPTRSGACRILCRGRAGCGAG
jgi:hypothetical protein